MVLLPGLEGARRSQIAVPEALSAYVTIDVKVCWCKLIVPSLRPYFSVQNLTDNRQRPSTTSDLLWRPLLIDRRASLMTVRDILMRHGSM
jgi:hypothetical protein